MQLFSADATIFVKEFRNFFAHENIKKLPSKVAYLWQFGFLSLCSPDCPKHIINVDQDTSVYYSVVLHKYVGHHLHVMVVAM
jgi:hypothetical protein